MLYVSEYKDKITVDKNKGRLCYIHLILKSCLWVQYEEAPAIITNKALMPKWANLKAFQNFSIEFLQGTTIQNM